MSWYRRSDVVVWLEGQGCFYEESYLTSLGFSRDDGIAFSLPDPDNDGWFHAELVDMVLADRWIGVGQARPPRFADKTE